MQNTYSSLRNAFLQKLKAYLCIKKKNFSWHFCSWPVSCSFWMVWNVWATIQLKWAFRTFKSKVFLKENNVFYLYCDENRNNQWNISCDWEKSRGQSPMDFQGLRLYFTIYRNSSHNTDVLNYHSSIVLSWIAILEELILHIALTAGAILFITSF